MNTYSERTKAVPMSKRQADLMKSLIQKRQVPADLADNLRAIWNTSGMTQAQASAYLTLLDQYPLDESVPTAVDHSEILGLHMYGKSLLKVTAGPGGELVFHSLVSKDGVTSYKPRKSVNLSKISKATKLSPETIDQIGTLLSVCLGCGRKSVSGQIHPKCEGKAASA